MEKEENLNQENASKESLEEINKPEDQTEKVEKSSSTEEKKEISPCLVLNFCWVNPLKAGKNVKTRNK